MSEEEVKKRLNKLIDLGDWLIEFENCGLPQLLHKGTCTRLSHPKKEEAIVPWREFIDKMKPLIAWMKRSRDTERTETMWKKGL